MPVTYGVCNMLVTLAKPPWTKPLNWNLHMTEWGEERVPFYAHVDFGAVEASPSPSLFQRFNQLPTELQLRILSFCSAPTLYQFMQTSMLRTEAAKLFWADPNTYYLIGARWLLKGGQTGYTRYDISFMAHAQYVEIEWNSDAEARVKRLRSPDIDQKIVRDFWQTFVKRFPAARKVVVNYDRAPRVPEHSPVPFSEAVKAIVEAAPATIDVTAFVVAQKNCERAALLDPSNFRRALRRYTEDGGWEEVPFSKRTTVLIPPRRFHGPVGEAMKCMDTFRRTELQLRGLNALAVEALDRHYFDKDDPEPFYCAISGCSVYFEKAGQCIQHAAEVHSDQLIYDTWPAHPSDTMRSVFQERRNEIEQKRGRLLEWVRRLRKDWQEQGGEKKREMERAWKYQIENDPEWDAGTPWMEHEIWKRFAESISLTSEG